MRKGLTWKQFFNSPLFFIVGIALLLLLSVNLTRAQLRGRVIRSEILKLQDETTALERERQSYEALIAFLQSPDFLEKEARRTLGYAKPGEQVVVIEREQQEQLQQQEQPISNPRKWWVYFFGKT